MKKFISKSSKISYNKPNFGAKHYIFNSMFKNINLFVIPVLLSNR